MRFEDAEELKLAILSSAERLEKREVFDKLISLIKLSSFSIIPKKPPQPRSQAPVDGPDDPLEGTAYIRATSYGTYHVRFYESFIERYLKTEEDCLFIMLHELEHLRQGDHHRVDITDGHEDHQLLNVVADILINSRLCQQFFPRGVPFFDTFYSMSPESERAGHPRPGDGVNLFSVPLIPPMVLFKCFEADYVIARAKLGLYHLPERFCSYEGYTIDQYDDYSALAREALTSILSQACSGSCRDVIINIYVMGWFGKPTVNKLFKSYKSISSEYSGLCKSKAEELVRERLRRREERERRRAERERAERAESEGMRGGGGLSRASRRRSMPGRARRRAPLRLGVSEPESATRSARLTLKRRFKKTRRSRCQR